ncbi:MAG: type IV secretory system conjugative DNA transfer family protein [Acidimicrobiales bacterium]
MAASRAADHGVYLGQGSRGPVFAPPEHCVLVLGPPRSGKTSGLVVPNVLTACGSVLSASTKPDVLLETAPARSRAGTCMLYDPSGRANAPPGVELVGWSPLVSASSWDGAVLTADAMVGAARPARVDAESSHWSERAGALLACLLHAASIDGGSLDSLVSSVNRHDADRARAVLAREDADLATDLLEGIVATDGREQSGIWSTTSGVLSGYRTTSALESARLPVFDAARFVRDRSTLYVATGAEHQRHAAPLVAGIVRDIRSAAYDLAAVRLRDRRVRKSGAPAPPDDLYGSTRRDSAATRATGAFDAGTDAPVLLVLDELAGIAPLHDLANLVAEGASQGLTTLACLQDLSQARRRWGTEADGFLTLFGTKVVLPGIGDTRTLESLSVLAGEVEVERVSRTSSTGFLRRQAPSRTISTQRLRRLPPDRIADPLDRTAVVFTGTRAGRVHVTPHHEAEPWRSVTRPPAGHGGGWRSVAARSGGAREPAGRGVGH